jgi:ribonucleoside-diphosphate reductase alpha chain
MGRVKMMAACQPFLSGAISKPVNLPSNSDSGRDPKRFTTKVESAGLKALAVYRDNCKVGQPLSDSKGKTDEVVATEDARVATRRRLPESRPAQTTSFSVGGAERLHDNWCLCRWHACLKFS